MLILPLLILSACGDKAADSAGDDTEAPAADYAADVQEVFNRSCISCHNAAGSYDLALEVDMSLEEGLSYDALVGVDSVQLPSMKRVAPGAPDSSYFWHKLNDTHIAAGGSGDEMPPGLTLASTDLEPIRRWIEQGAAP